MNDFINNLEILLFDFIMSSKGVSAEMEKCSEVTGITARINQNNQHINE